jgi:hypothetical protein
VILPFIWWLRKLDRYCQQENFDMERFNLKRLKDVEVSITRIKTQTDFQLWKSWMMMMMMIMIMIMMKWTFIEHGKVLERI